MPPSGASGTSFGRSRLDDDLRQELETHLALIEEEERVRGASTEQARQRARSRFGHPLAHREHALDAVMATWLESAVKDATFAARRLVRSPTFTLATVLTLALAIGANASIFAVVQRVVLNPLPYPDSDRLIVLDHAAGVEALARPGPAPWMTLGALLSLRRSGAHARRRRHLPNSRADRDRKRRAGTDPCRTRDHDARIGDARLAGAGSLVHG